MVLYRGCNSTPFDTTGQSLIHVLPPSQNDKFHENTIKVLKNKQTH